MATSCVEASLSRMVDSRNPERVVRNNASASLSARDVPRQSRTLRRERPCPRKRSAHAWLLVGSAVALSTATGSMALTTAGGPTPGATTDTNVCPVKVPQGDWPASAYQAAAAAVPRRVSLSAPGGANGVATLGAAGMLSITGLCQVSNFQVVDFLWEDPGLAGGDWMAKPQIDHGVRLTLDGNTGDERADGSGGMRCGLSGISVNNPTAPELRFLFDGCGGPSAVFVVPLQKQNTAGNTRTRTNLVNWMCQVSPALCGRAMLAPKIQPSTSMVAQAQTPPPSTIFVGRQISEEVVGRGRCNTSGISYRQVASVNLRACRLECVQRITTEINSSEATQLSKPCVGFAFQSQTQACYIYDSPSPSTIIADSDGITGWSCYALQPGVSSYAHAYTSTPAPVLVPTVEPRIEAVLDLTQILDAGIGGGTATRVQIAPTVPGCFDSVEWCTFDGFFPVPSVDWDFLVQMITLLATPSLPGSPKRPQASAGGTKAPAKLVVGRVCVTACDGHSMPAPCRPVVSASSGAWSWAMPLILATNVLTAIAVCLGMRQCMPEHDKIRQEFFQKVFITDGVDDGAHAAGTGHARSNGGAQEQMYLFGEHDRAHHEA